MGVPGQRRALPCRATSAMEPYEHPQMIPWTPPTMHLRLNFGRPRWHARQARRVLTWPAPSKTPGAWKGPPHGHVRGLAGQRVVL